MASSSSGTGNNLDKTLTKPPKASGTIKPRLKVVKVRKTWDFADATRHGLLAVEIDDSYAYIKSSSDYHETLKKPAWLVDPKSDIAVWFAQDGTNTVILYRDVAYLLLRVSQGSAYEKACNNTWCKEPLTTCPSYHRRGHHRRWVLKPIVLPAEAEEYVLGQLEKAL